MSTGVPLLIDPRRTAALCNLVRIGRSFVINESSGVCQEGLNNSAAALYFQSLHVDTCCVSVHTQQPLILCAHIPPEVGGKMDQSQKRLFQTKRTADTNT